MEKIICSALKNLTIWTVLFGMELYKRNWKYSASSDKILAPSFPHSYYSSFVAHSSDTQQASHSLLQFLLHRFCRCHSFKNVTGSAPCISIKSQGWEKSNGMCLNFCLLWMPCCGDCLCHPITVWAPFREQVNVLANASPSCPPPQWP